MISILSDTHGQTPVEMEKLSEIEHHNEVIVAVGVVRHMDNHQTLTSYHLHYVHAVGKKHQFGCGGALEAVADEKVHFTVCGMFQYKFHSGFLVGYMPGIIYKPSFEPKQVIGWAQHFEAAYNFKVGKMHLGPMLELGLEPHESHFTGGLHVGFEFM